MVSRAGCVIVSVGLESTQYISMKDQIPEIDKVTVDARRFIGALLGVSV
jgi:hypothetical protein